MKPLLFYFLIFLLTTATFAQKSNDDAVYLDSLHNMSNEIHYKYIRIVKDYYLQKELYSFSEYYKSGKIAFRGFTKNKLTLIPDGNCISYYENGNKKIVSNYIDSRITGKEFGWYDNGKINFENEYIYDKKTKNNTKLILNYFDKNNVQLIVDGNGSLEYKVPNESSKEIIKNGLQKVVSGDLYNKLNSRYIETYKDGKFISGESFDENNTSYKYTEAEIKPEPKGGWKFFFSYITKKFNLSQEASSNNIKGKVYMTFVIDIDGKIINPRVLRDLGYGTGEEAIRVLKEFKDWTPGKIRGQSVRCTFSLPINIDSGVVATESPNQSPYGMPYGT